MTKRKPARSKRPRPPNTKARSAADVLSDLSHWRRSETAEGRVRVAALELELTTYPPDEIKRAQRARLQNILSAIRSQAMLETNVSKSEHLGREIRHVENEIKQLEDDPVDRRQRALEESAATAIPPHQGWLPIAKERIQANGTVYNRGSVVPIEKLGPNLQAILKRIDWVPPGTVCEVQSVPAPPSTPEPGPIKVVIVRGDDKPEAFRATLRASMEASPGRTYGEVRGAVIADKEGGQIYILAVRVQSEIDARASGQYGRRVVPANL